MRGSSDMTSCEQIRQLFVRCRRIIGEGNAIVLDLNNVDQADTKLMACLVAVYQLARASSVRMELCPSMAVRDVVEVCRLGWLLEQTRACSNPSEPVG